MFGLAAAPDVAIAMPSVKPRSSCFSAAYVRVDRNAGAGAASPCVLPSAKPEYSGVSANDAALRSCHARFLPCEMLSAALTM